MINERKMMNTVELIRKKRNREELTSEEISQLINGYTKGTVPDYQFSSFLMAGFLNGFTEAETTALTSAMLYSGKVLDLSAIKGIKVDKHSTGGVGDKTSLIIAPIAAAAGVPVPMISGRALGHTGGTLDKLESIPGFRTDLNLAEYKKVLKKCSAVLIGQTKEIAPADKGIYALRDVTATVESIPLITASIMSKKLAEGIDALVLDVKTGNGAFMRSYSDAQKLAASLVSTAKRFNKKVIAYITDMNQPLGRFTGNWPEVYESLLVLQGYHSPRLTELSIELAGAMIFLGGKAKNLSEGRFIAAEMITSGKAFDKFLQIAKLQGANIKYLENPDSYPKPRYSAEYLAARDGYINYDCFQSGMAAVEAGAGRLTKDDKPDKKAGIITGKLKGEKVKKGDRLASVFGDNKEKVLRAMQRMPLAITISAKPVPKDKLIRKVIS